MPLNVAAVAQYLGRNFLLGGPINFRSDLRDSYHHAADDAGEE
jgi:hypothetical protein